MERGIKILFTFVMRQITSNIFGKIIPKPLEVRKDLSSPRMTEQI